MLLHPERITLTANFEAPAGPTAVERAITSIGKQIDARRAADAAHAQVAPLWNLAIWRYLPADPTSTLNSRVAADDDPFFTPQYMTLSGRQLDHQLKLTEKTGYELLH
ncbi:MAG: hypothetical protein ACJ8KU_02620 [Chthoniobacterales bacterium]